MCMSLLRNSEKFGAGAGDVYGAGRKMYVGGSPQIGFMTKICSKSPPVSEQCKWERDHCSVMFITIPFRERITFPNIQEQNNSFGSWSMFGHWITMKVEL